MAIIKSRKCIVCGKEYEYCNGCKSHMAFPAWMAIYHDENCKNIMNVATEYMAGNLTKADAKAKLDCCDLTNKRNFKDSILKIVNEICTVKRSAKIEVIKASEEVVENSEKNVENSEKIVDNAEEI